MEDNQFMNVSFDTLTAARELEAAGIERPQAEAIAKTMRESRRSDLANLANLATKADLAEVRTEIAAVRTEIANLETRLVRWIVGTVLTTAGLTVAIVRLFLV